MLSLKEMRGKLQCFSKTGIKILPEKKNKKLNKHIPRTLGTKIPPCANFNSHKPMRDCTKLIALGSEKRFIIHPLIISQ